MTRLILLAIALVAASCSGRAARVGEDLLKRFTPSVKFERLDLQRFDFGEIEVYFMFDLTNPDPVEVELDDVSYVLDLEGHQVVRKERVRLAALGAVDPRAIAIPVTLRFEDVFAAVAEAARGKDALRFELSGDFRFKTPAGPVSVSVRELGDFPVVRAPSLRLAGLRADGVDLSAASVTLTLELEVTYPDGGTSIGLDRLDYALSLAGRVVASGASQPLGRVAAGQTRVVGLPVTVAVAELGQSVVDAITGRTPLDAKLSGSVAVQTPIGAVALKIEEQAQVPIR